MEADTRLPEFQISPMRAFKSVFDSENWPVNLLWLSLAYLTSSIFVGTIGLYGWGAELLRSRAGRPENRTPDIDSNRLGDYISQGLWPFLVSLVIQFVFSIVAVIPIFGGFGVLAAIVGSAAGEDAIGFLALVALPPLVLVAVIFGGLLSVSLVTRAMICQDFGLAFNLPWIKDFIRVMWKDILLSGIIFILLSAAVSVIGFLALCVGAIPATGLIFGAAMHMHAQWYELYLSRGGEPVPTKNPQPLVDATIV